MLHLGIDLHQRHLTIVIMNDAGDIVLRRGKVSTSPESVVAFLREVQELAGPAGGYRAIVEECGFTVWLVELLEQFECQTVIIVQPLERSKHKTDKRDAAKLAESLWINRDRISAGKRMRDIRQVMKPSETDRQCRLLTNGLISIRRQRTRVMNISSATVRRFNLIHDCPTKGFNTKKARVWLRELDLPVADRMILDQTLVRWEEFDRQIPVLEAEVDMRAENHPAAMVLRTIPGFGSLTSLAVASRIGPIGRFPRPSSLANMFGLTPTINDSGETTGRIGKISKEGHPNMRFLLGMAVHMLTQKDPEVRKVYRAIRKRRGGKTATVAVMRRLSCTMWHMLQTGEAYRIAGKQ